MTAFLRGSHAFLWTAIWFAASTAVAEPRADLPRRPLDQGQSWALLVGVEGYQLASPLVFTNNDVVRLSEALIDRAGVAPERILRMTDAEEDSSLHPNKANLEARIEEWLALPGADDQIIVYFSGHGFRAADERMYLAPLDCDPDSPATTGVSVSWLRDKIAACRARMKLLVLDSCHAGSEKGDEAFEIAAAKDLGERFRDLTGVVTLASSGAEEKSQLWPEMEQSLYSYWLVQALKGHADDDGDGDLTIDELNEYLHRNVAETATKRFSRKQTPVRIVRAGTPGDPIAVRLQPNSLENVLEDMADELAWALAARGYESVGVLEFTNDTPLGELLGADFGLIGRYCAEELERMLAERSDQGFSVVNRRRLQSALRSQQFDVDDIGSPEALTQLAERAGGMPVLAVGVLRSRQGRLVSLRCELLEAKDVSIAATAGGTAWLNESEWAMLGRSAVLAESDRNSAAAAPDAPTRATAVVAKLDAQAAEPHPMQAGDSPFRISLLIDGQVREPVFRGNDMFVPVSVGETYQVFVENDSNETVVMRLLVDGLNTLPQKIPTKGIQTVEVAPRVNLESARGWVLDPAVSQEFAVKGFVTETGAAGAYREFDVVDADQSLAARRQFTEQVGVITAAFYAPARDRGAVGTGLGDEGRDDLTVRKGVQPGDLLCVIHLRYVDANSLVDA